eukprot:4309486-Amphidinium_carterae.1
MFLCCLSAGYSTTEWLLSGGTAGSPIGRHWRMVHPWRTLESVQLDAHLGGDVPSPAAAPPTF